MKAEKIRNLIFLLAAILFSITAYYSKGFHHYDEHFQILEFAGLKLGLNQPGDLAWEYGAHIRPSFQPWLVTVAVKLFNIIHISSPFTQIFFIRLLLGWFILWGIYRFTEMLNHSVGNENKIYFYLLSCFLYFIPYASVRFSSETLSGAFFLYAITCALKDKKKGTDFLVLGLLTGLSFVSRFQMAFMIIGLAAWLIVIAKVRYRAILVSAAGFSLVLLGSVLCDYWFYQKWVFTPFDYFRINIVEGKAASFGIEPWYYYVNGLFNNGIITVVKLLTVTACFIFFFINRKSAITFCLVPFLIAHIFVNHKEIRFMIPIIYYLPYMVVYCWQHMMERVKNYHRQQILRLVFFQFLCINCTSLFANTFKPADGQPLVYEYLSEHYHNRPLHIYYENSTAYNWICGQAALPMNFYKEPGFVLTPIGKQQIKSVADTITFPAVFITDYYTNLEKYPVRKMYEVLNWRMRMFNEHDWMKMKNADWVVYRMNQKKQLK